MGHLKSLKKKKQPNKLEPVVQNSKKVEIRIPGENDLKMSEVLMEFVRPMLANAKDQVEENASLRIAVICWNLSYLPQQQINQYLDKFIKGNSEDIEKKIYLRLMLEKLVERRQKYYYDIKRLITDFKVTPLPEEDSWYLQVMSAPINDEDLKDFKTDTDSQSQ